jgi:hypothetical protein
MNTPPPESPPDEPAPSDKSPADPFDELPLSIVTDPDPEVNVEPLRTKMAPVFRPLDEVDVAREVALSPIKVSVPN